MSFLAPLFLLGGLAAALPVLFHLMRRTTRERTLFSSVMFLMPSPPRFTRRSRLEHLLLLALRCSVIGLLSLGFARPFLRKLTAADSPSAAGRRLVVLVDTSASMRRAGLWPDALHRAGSILRDTIPADQAAVFTFDRQVRPVMTFEEWNAAPAGDRAAIAGRKLAGATPGWSATHTGNALIHAADMLADTTGQAGVAPGRVWLITDLQQASRLETLQGYQWPRNVELSVIIVKPRRTGNAALQWIADATGPGGTPNGGVRVRISNDPDSPHDLFAAGWAQLDSPRFIGPATNVYVPAGQSRVLTLPPPVSPGSPGRILLRGDEDDFDNAVFAVSPEPARATVLYAGKDFQPDPRRPLFFLQRAFQATPRQAVEVLPRDPAGGLAPDAASAALFVVTDPLSEDNLRVIHDQVHSGKTALFVLRNETPAAGIARLLGLEHLECPEVRPSGYAMLAEIDFRHPVFAPFADPQYSDFTRIHFWRYRRVDAAAIPGARVPARFDSGDPALLEVPLGKGSVLILTSSWEPEESQLALSTKFVPLLFSLLEHSGMPAPAAAQFRVGDGLPLDLPAGGVAPRTVRLPDGSEITAPAGLPLFSQTDTPGIYTLTGSKVPRHFAVNLDAAESRIAALSLDDLERAGAPVSRRAAGPQVAARMVRLQNAEIENRQKLWRWLLAGALGVLLLETGLAARAARRQAPPPDSEPQPSSS